MAKKEEDAEFFVRIESPSEFRKTLIESRRDVVQTLEKYEMLRAIRVQKVKYMADLKNVIKDVQVMLGKLKEALPKTKLREKLTKKASIKILRSSPSKKASSELDELEQELKKIQSKLNIIG